MSSVLPLIARHCVSVLLMEPLFTEAVLVLGAVMGLLQGGFDCGLPKTRDPGLVPDFTGRTQICEAGPVLVFPETAWPRIYRPEISVV